MDLRNLITRNDEDEAAKSSPTIHSNGIVQTSPQVSPASQSPQIPQAPHAPQMHPSPVWQQVPSRTSFSSIPPQASYQQQLQIPTSIPINKVQPRLSIHNLMNDERPSLPTTAVGARANLSQLPAEDGNGKISLAPIRSSASSSPTSSIIYQQVRTPIIEPSRPVLSSLVTSSKTSSPKTPGNEIRRRSSITNITNEEDVDMDGHKTPNVARRHSSTATLTPASSEMNELKKESPTERQSPTILAESSGKREEPSEQTVEHKPDLEKTKSSTIEEEIHNLEVMKEIESTEEKNQKPRRYVEKPTWAKDYIPKLLRAGHHGNKVSIANPTKLSVASITGSIPRNNFNKLVTEWIWANIQGIKQDFVDVPNVETCIELELKVGSIWDKIKDRRIQLPVNTECIVSSDFIHQNCFFRSGISPKNFGDINGYLQKLAQDAQNRKKKDKFIIETSHNVDLIASEKKRNDKLVTERVTLDVKTKRRVASIEKQRVSDLFIYLPNTLFDLRLSMSLELPHEMNDPAFENFRRRVNMERDKDRTSYIHPATATRIDITKIKENQVTKYELEMELNTPELLRSMSMVSDDPLYYVDLVQAFLDNGRIITRQLSVQY
ncbi:DEKNAAC100028 [Brettanomyces naardenensis]|uniref:mRNA-capping enzyme subunit beta n=1 Tax=Brettanomyces naardenensis TaxID=13370 RepID=A0A448YFS6_BRENA|nr:DEKNAAC100028 [Brettanomyces naardenensis]